MWNIQLFKLNYDIQEINAVTSVLKNGWLSMGDNVTEFETRFAEHLGNDITSLCVTNGTAAMHTSLLALNIQHDEEVIIPALTFVSDANCVFLNKSTPVLADSVSLDNWNVSAETISRVITPKTKAVVIVHFAGYPCDMPSIYELCREHDLFLIEDVAHAPGASIDGRSCGTWGDFGCFSFFSNKNLSIGEGGMVTSSNPELIEKIKYLRSHGMTSLTQDRHKGRATSYDVLQPGLNYRMDEMRAALGLIQLKKLSSGNQKRRQLTERYRLNLQSSGVAIPFQFLPDNHISAYHILPTLLPIGCNRLKTIEHLKSEGIQSSIHYPPFWSFQAYKDMFSPADAPIAAEICDRELTLPLFPTMTDEEVDLVCKVLLSYF